MLDTTESNGNSPETPALAPDAGAAFRTGAIVKVCHIVKVPRRLAGPARSGKNDPVEIMWKNGGSPVDLM
jgi:hypothetical protein